jgi:hypothetical protein
MVSFYIYIYGICIVTDILLSWYGEFLYIYGICIVTDILLSWYGEFLGITLPLLTFQCFSLPDFVGPL